MPHHNEDALEAMDRRTARSCPPFMAEEHIQKITQFTSNLDRTFTIAVFFLAPIVSHFSWQCVSTAPLKFRGLSVNDVCRRR